MPRRKKVLDIDLADLATALDDHSELAWYLDTKTGEVLPVPADADDDLLPVPREELVESERFIFIEPIESECGWGEMRDFAGSVADQHLRGLLEVALAGKGAFGRFKDVLAAHGKERALWFARHDRWMEEQARVWLDRQGIQSAERVEELGHHMRTALSLPVALVREADRLAGELETRLDEPVSAAVRRRLRRSEW